MKCEEVVEWMHRYLDHDLGEAETTQISRKDSQVSGVRRKF